MKTGDGRFLEEDASNYSSEKYKKPSVTVDVAICAIIEDELKILLIQRKYPPFRNHWALPGGFLDVDKKESLEDAAARELYEETKLKGLFFEQLKAYGEPERDPRMRIITIAYYALLPYDKVSAVQARGDARDKGWFSLASPPADLAFDHRQILLDTLIRIRNKAENSAIAFNLLPTHFTWSALQKVYESILGRKVLAPNFRRRLKATFNLQETSYWASKGQQLLGRKPVLLKLAGLKRPY